MSKPASQEKSEGKANQKPATGAPSNKEVVYKAWKASKGKATVETLHAKVKEAVKATTIRSWLSDWGRNKNLPACAKQ